MGKLDVDFETSAVWKPGEGAVILARGRKEREDRLLSDSRPKKRWYGIWVALRRHA